MEDIVLLFLFSNMDKIILFEESQNKYVNSIYRDFNFIDKLPVHSDDIFPEKFKCLSTNQDENFYLENYGNKLCSLEKEYYLLVVEKKQNRISLKLFLGTRFRKVGQVFFRLKKQMRFITVDLEKGDVYFGEMFDYHKKRKCIKNLKKNYFLSDPINDLRSWVKSLCTNYGQNGSEIFEKALTIFMKEIDPQNKYNLSPHKRILKFYLDKKFIKYPNNFNVFYCNWISSDFRRLLKKNENKVVETFMKIHQLNGKNIKKALHNCSSLNVTLLKDSVILFGDLIMKDYQLILEILNFNINNGFSSLEERRFGDLKETFSKAELNRVFHIFKKVILEESLNFYTFSDHISMYLDLRSFGEKIKWYADDEKVKFVDEHLDWTNKIDYYKKGTYTRTYPKYFDNLDVIEVSKSKYFPILLKESSEYSYESICQSNCVKTYIGRPASIIISLRKDSEVSDDRATIEYYLKKIYDNVEIVRVQTLGKYNSKLTDDWDIPIEKLDKMVLGWVNNKEFETVKIEKICANGIKFESDSHFDERGNLTWTYKKNNSVDYYFQNDIFW